MNVDKSNWEPDNNWYRVGDRIAWWDRYSKNWIAYTVDENDYQQGDADYYANKDQFLTVEPQFAAGSNGSAFTTTKHRRGCYRTRRLYSHAFGQVVHDGRQWNAEIRQRDTGSIIRFAGIWPTRKAALEECQSILSDVRYSE